MAYLRDIEEFGEFLTSRENISAHKKILDVQTETMRAYLAYSAWPETEKSIHQP